MHEVENAQTRRYNDGPDEVTSTPRIIDVLSRVNLEQSSWLTGHICLLSGTWKVDFASITPTKARGAQ